MDLDKSIIEKLNKILEQEHACAIRYATHAAVITGPASEAISARLHEIADDEISHAKKLRERILALGGKPSLQVSLEDLKEAYTLEDILRINMREEADAIAAYTEVLKMVPETNVILYRTLQDLIADEQDHLEEISNLR